MDVSVDLPHSALPYLADVRDIPDMYYCASLYGVGEKSTLKPIDWASAIDVTVCLSYSFVELYFC